MRKMLLPKSLVLQSITGSLLEARAAMYADEHADRLSFINACRAHDELLTIFILLAATPDEVYDKVMEAASETLNEQFTEISGPSIV